MSISTINTQLVSQQLEPIDSLKAQPTATHVDFVTQLKTALDTVSATQLNAYQKSQAFAAGDPNTSLNEAMVDMQKSTVSLQFAIQVRSKLIAAYQEIMNMSV